MTEENNEVQAFRVAVILDGVVENTILAAADFEMDGFDLIPSDTAQIGDSYADGVFTSPPPAPLPVPEIISDRQFFHALAVSGQITEAEALQAVKTGDPPAAMDAFLAALPADQEFGARMLLEGATTFQRSHPLTLAFASGMNMTAEQTDDLWRLAASL